MKKKSLVLSLLVILAILLIILFLGFFNSAKAEETLTGQKAAEIKDSWKPFAEISISASNKVVDEYLGGIILNEKSLTESISVGMEKNKKGFYLWVDNFFPSHGESRETDIYLGAYAEFSGFKIDVGYGRYWVREVAAIDFNGVYAEITLPAPIWQITPFAKMEYRFGEKVELEDGSKVSLDGFVYYGGLKREFEVIPKWVNLNAEVSVGGNTGIYGMPAENLSFAREKLEATISITEWLKIKGSAMTQQNLGHKEGIAADTDKLFLSAGIVAGF